ncbi:DNA-formamidopyrimidine glycosylase family protein [Segetibacter aerophilus]|uniref:Formamidopyrimidine-DNA glycosylase n=1 Tax=Segetibacter aerophilus TaxID=670293 RepID=A0A512B9U5_9BACT|nr:DNA-formamidopyrimidine glycosylase family protein [Segetibacter aerophilus]GEO08734.1 formamidopyrimidine-DNA glycosylase [Segetibacter aerophilus]
MPEIPDIEVFAHNVKAQFAGKRITKVIVVNGNKLKDTPEELSQSLEGHILNNVYRSGKEFRLELSSGTTVGMHLMLTGDLYPFTDKNENKFTIVELHFEDGSGLALTDRMRNAHIKLNPQDKDGVDALSDELDFKYLKKIFSRKATVKNVLLDQGLIRGIGNGYSDDILWVSKVSPFSTASAIPDKKIKDIAKAIKVVLTEATQKIHEAHPGLITGEAKEFLLVHRQKVSPTGKPIKVEQSGSRKTYYTDEQKMYS